MQANCHDNKPASNSDQIYLGPEPKRSLIEQAKITTTHTFGATTKIQEQCFRLTMRQIIDKRLEQRVSIENRIE